MDEAAAAVAAHLGEVEEDKINNMSYVWFNLVLEALGKRLNYSSISNLYGNSFAKDAAKLVQQAYPLAKHNSSASNVGSMIGMTKFTTIDVKDKQRSKEALGKALGGDNDTSWFEEFLK